MVPLILLVSVSLLLTVILLAALLASPLAPYFADQPNHRKVHVAVIPRLGGMGVVLSFLLMLVVADVFGMWQPSARLHYSIAFTGLFLLVAGTLDDVISLGYRAKFLLQFLLAAVIVLVFHMQFESMSLLGTVFPLHGMGAVISIFWIVGLMNAVNIIDGIDGLAASVALVGFAGIGALAWMGGAINPLAVCAVLCGSMIGFLYYNLQRRRKVFLGDTGSQFLGAMLGILTMRIHDLASVGYSVLIPLLLVGYPLLDTSVAMARRFLRMRHRAFGHRVTRMFVADNEHLHHRLVYAGLSHVQSTFLLMLLASGFAVTAVIMPRVSWQTEALITAYLGGAVLFLLNRLGFLQVGSLRRALREGIFGGRPAEGFARRYTRYYEIFNWVEPGLHPATVAATRAPVPAPAPIPEAEAVSAAAATQLAEPAAGKGA